MKFRDFIVIVIGILTDQLSKYMISTHLSLGVHVKVIENFFYLTNTRNTGAAWSMLSGEKWLFVVIAVLACAAITFYIVKDKVKGLERIGLLLIISGAIGNVIDRLVYSYVIDFLDFYIFGYDYPVFNLADSWICIGVVLLLLDLLLTKEKKKNA